MNFEYPGFLWLLPLAVLVWFVPRRGVRASHGLLRTLVVCALIIGIARPVLVRPAWTDHHVVVVDRSASIADAASIERALRNVQQALPDDGERVLVEIGGGAVTDRAKGFDRHIVVHGDEASPLGVALERALRAIPEGTGGAITLISDGMATDAGWHRAMQELTERGLPLHAVELAGVDDVRPVDLQLLDDLRVGHVGHVRVTVAADTASVRLQLTADGEVVASSPEFSCVGVQSVDLALEPSNAGYVQLAVEVVRADGGDDDASNNTLTRTVAVQDPLRVLYLGARVQGAAAHLGELVGDGFDIREPDDGRELDLERTDLTVLDDRPASEVPTAWQNAMVEAVQRRGMGLFVSGGRSAFGPGGYHETPIETVSPVEYVQKEEKKDPSTTLAVVIDTSGSMVGNRMTLAKEVARLAIRRLQPHDKVGIVEFYGTKQWAAPIQSAANSIDLQRALNRLGASGGTVLFPAVEECFYALKNVQTRYKHVLVITDAGVETGPYEALLRKMADEGIATSTVLVGPGRHSEFLVELADWGGGRYYHSPDRFNLPELLLKKPNTSMLPPYRPGTFPIEARGGRGWWGDVDPTKIPPLETIVETAPRKGANVLLSVAGSARPVLASWQYGLGRVTAMATEPVGPGTGGWSEWPGYGPMLGRVLSRTSRSSQPPFAFALRRDATHLFVEARRVKGTEVPVLRDEDGDEVAMREVAAGVFRGRIVARPTDTSKLTASTASGWQHRLCSDSVDARVAETQVDPRNALPMNEVAEATGGSFVTDGAVVPPLSVARNGSPLQVHALWPWLLLLSLLAFLMDVFHRRRAVGTRRLA